MATAILDSVTVSIGEDINGTETVIRLDTREVVLTSAGTRSLSAGCSKTSSNVKPKVAKG